MKKSVRNLMIATGIVVASGFILKRMLDSKKKCIIDKGEVESIENKEDDNSSEIENTRKYHTIHVYKKTPIEK